MIKKAIKKSISKSFLRKVLMNIGSHYIKSYSQEGEDMILRRLFEKKKEGFYVDVGAHHPKRFSNTYFFYKKGWKGINIDAMPNSMKLFKKTRPRDINIEIPISEQKQKLKYYAFDEPAINGFSKEISEKRSRTEDVKILFTKEIETTTLENILTEYLPKDQTIDFLSIDVEGLDFEVLKSNNFKIFKPNLILVEIIGSNLCEIEKSEITKYLNNLGYDIYAKTINTVFFAKKTFLNERKK